MADRNLEFRASLRVNSKAKAFRDGVQWASQHAIRDILNRARELARENVAPGKGPSPHAGDYEDGHNSPMQRPDTGNLQRSIRRVLVFQGFMTDGYLVTDLDYGTYLEVGWRRGGKFFRYPWMKPAFLQAMSEFPSMAGKTFQRAMHDLDEDKVVNGETLDSWGIAAERWAKDLAATQASQRQIEEDKAAVEDDARNPVFVRNPRLPKPKHEREFLPHNVARENAARLKRIRDMAGKVKDVKPGRKAKNRFGDEKPSAYRLEKNKGESTTEAYERKQRELQAAADARNKKLREANEKLRSAGSVSRNSTGKKKRKKKKS